MRNGRVCKKSDAHYESWVAMCAERLEGSGSRAWLEGRPITDEPDGLKYSNYVEKTAHAGVFVHP
jgi:hypothetical protein